MADEPGMLPGLFKAAAEAKQDVVVEYLEEVLEQTNKVIVFAHHRFMLDAIETSLLKQKVSHMRIDGSTAAADRKSRVAEFQEGAAGPRVALLSITACSEGLTLTAASTIVFAELYWVPGTMEQAEDRAHRIGQTASRVDLHYLVAKGTADEWMFGILQRKKREVSLVLDGKITELDCGQKTARPAAQAPSANPPEAPAEVEPPAKKARTGPM